MSWREIEHTADWAIVVEAPTLDDLFLEAARGLYEIAGRKALDGAQAVAAEIEVDGPDDETLLVAFLDELLFWLDVRGVAFDSIEIQREGEVLRAQLGGGVPTNVTKTIKAVTFHDLEIVQDASGFHVTLVFDV